MKVGEKVRLLVDKPKSTKGKEYLLIRKDTELRAMTDYWYINDYGKRQCVNADEIESTDV